MTPQLALHTRSTALNYNGLARDAFEAAGRRCPDDAVPITNTFHSSRIATSLDSLADPRTYLIARPVQLPELIRDRRALDGVAVLRWGALDGANNRDVADINTVALQPLRVQTDELCLRRIGERDTHGVQADGEHIHHRTQVAQCAVGDEDGAFRHMDALVAQMDHLQDNYARVWVEALMAARLLFDAQNRGLIDRVREMTTRYLEKTAPP